MPLKRMLGVSILAGTFATSLLADVPTISSGSAARADAQVRYRPLESMSYDFGSKFMSGYFLERAAQCVVTLMVIEKSDPDELLPVTAARFRLIMRPGQIAGLDSEEGRSLNVTCGDGATTMSVDVGETERLSALQTHILPTEIARPQ